MRILSHTDRIEQILEGSFPVPRMAIVYPTYKCDMDCIGCEYRQANLAGYVMPAEQLKGLIDQLASFGIRAIEFCGGGEPTNFGTLDKMIRYAAGRGLKIGLMTNGTKLTRSLVSALIRHGSYVRISLDAARPETYSRSNSVKKS